MKDSNIEFEDFFIHDSGAAIHKKGFHKYLEEFLGLNLPFCPTYNGKDSKLYIQMLFPAFYIEQKRGWSDFLVTIPKYYGIKHPSQRVIEFLLDLDVIKNKKSKIKIDDEKKKLIFFLKVR